MRSLIVTSLAALALSGFAAHAEEATMRVRIGDLNVHEEPGARAALRRIKYAATNFCGPINGYPLTLTRASKECRKEMTDKAVAKLDAPVVTALYAPQTATTTQLARR